MAGNIVPRTDGGSDLGTATKEFDTIYAKNFGGTIASKVVTAVSPAFTGVPTAPTAAAGTATTQLATTAFVAAGLAVKADASDLDDYAPLASPALTGTPTAPTQTAGDNSTKIATTEYVDSGLAEKADSTELESYTETINCPMFNKRDIITTSGTYTAPVTGWYKITAKGGGGGGNGAANNLYHWNGEGGGEGGTSFGYVKLTAGQGVSVVIGAGGSKGLKDNASMATSGGNTVVTVGSLTVTGGGGDFGGASGQRGGEGGTGDVCGQNGQGGIRFVNNADSLIIRYPIANGGGNALGYGSGGIGGSLNLGTAYDGGNGVQGVVWFEYFDASLN